MSGLNWMLSGSFLILKTYAIEMMEVANKNFKRVIVNMFKCLRRIINDNKMISGRYKKVPNETFTTKNYYIGNEKNHWMGLTID